MSCTNDEMKRINDDYTPQADLVIARYMSCEKLEKMLESKALFFCNANNFADKYEGEIPLSFFRGWCKNRAENYEKIYEWYTKIYVPYVSCWTPYVSDNSYMWKSYAGKSNAEETSDSVGKKRNSVNEKCNNDGVCIVTTVQKLFDCAQRNGGCVYKIHYLGESNEVDPIEVPFYFEDVEACSKFDSPDHIRVFHALKKKEYEKEREIRAVIYRGGKSDGLNIPIDLKEFIDKIVINPMASAEQKGEIKKLVNRYELADLLTEEKANG